MTPRVPTSKTPFSLKFKFKAVVPTELGLPSFRTSNFQVSEYDKALRQGLDLVEEMKDQPYIRAAAYKQRAFQYFNRKVKPCNF